MKRPRPVLIFGMVLAALTAVTTYADVENMMPNAVLNWLRLATVVLAAGGTFYVQNQVTPLSDPKAADGTPLRKLARGGVVAGPPLGDIRKPPTPPGPPPVG